ncbi:NB-ARC domain-containing protein [Amycolatopsis vastitatis]|uniref:NB-ARC domain-containing protein n=1 Tax=Amycolatopsis vastitatis TaxID=1905142 RepID=UPI0013042F1C|nr:NB-ARC domain-containing protein [Amycolatopsis vastitatis]
MIVAAVLVALAGTLAAVTVNLATAADTTWWHPIQAHPLRWTIGGTLAVAVTSVFAWWVHRRHEQRLATPIPAEQRPESWVVDRPVEVQEIITALLGRARTTVGITTAVQGAGGFGKTTVAKLVRADRRILRRFDGGIYWVTLGRDVRSKAAITGRVNQLLSQLDPKASPSFTEPQQAGEYLAAVLAAGPRRLLVLDDVWYPEQVAAFPLGGVRCRRLITTRLASLVDDCVPVRVDQVTTEQATELLCLGLRTIPSDLVHDLVAWTGRWPLLLRLVNKVLAGQQAIEPDVGRAAAELLDQLHRSGPVRIDELTGAVHELLDVNDPEQRRRAVSATIEASRGLLPTAARRRFLELGIFAEDETVPVTLIAGLWKATGRLDLTETRALCARLDDLALLSAAGGTVTMHDVVRDFLRQELDDSDPGKIRELNEILVRAAAAELPREGEWTAWWELDRTERYFRDHLVEHLLSAGLREAAEKVITDLRWIATRLDQAGPLGPYLDLSQVDARRCRRLALLLGQSAHLLAPTDPEYSRIDILFSRVAHGTDWESQAERLALASSHPRLVNRWPLPDLPDPGLRRAISARVTASPVLLAVPKRNSIAAACEDNSVVVWDVTTGSERLKLTGHARPVTAMAVAPDGSWFVTAAGDRTVRVWDGMTGQLRYGLEGHPRDTTPLIAAPSGTWFATATEDRKVRVWDVVTGEQCAVMAGHTAPITALIAGFDGRWLASAARDRSVRIWHPGTGKELRRFSLTYETGRVSLVTGRDGRWIAGACGAGMPQIWDLVAHGRRRVLSGFANTRNALAAAPDGSWLAGLCDDGSVQIWDVPTGLERVRLPHAVATGALAADPDGVWLAAAGEGHSVRMWDVRTGVERARFLGHGNDVRALVTAPDGSWLASAAHDGTVRIWDAQTTRERTRHLGNRLRLAASLVAPDGSWIATVGDDSGLGIWDVGTGERKRELDAHLGETDTLAVAPDGRWIAAACGEAVRIWDVRSGQEQTQVPTNARGAPALAAGTDWIAVVGDQRRVRIWDVRTGEERARLAGNSEPTRFMAAGGGGDFLITGSAKAVHVWDLVRGLPRVKLAGSEGVGRLVAAPDGTWIAGAAGRTVRLWDAKTGDVKAEFAGHADPVDRVVASPDGKWLASTDRGRTIRTWDVATGRERATLTGHETSGVVIAPHGDRLASVAPDRTVRVWNASTGRPLAVMRVEMLPQACAWALGGRAIVVAGSAGVCVFDFRPGTPSR